MVAIVLVRTESKQPIVFVLLDAVVQIHADEVVAQPSTTYQIRRRKEHRDVGVAGHANGWDVVF